MMEHDWRVRLTIEKNIKARSRGEAKAKLIEETRYSKLDSVFREPKAVYEFVPTNLGKPYLIDVSASKVNKIKE